MIMVVLVIMMVVVMVSEMMAVMMVMDGFGMMTLEVVYTSIMVEFEVMAIN